MTGEEAYTAGMADELVRNGFRKSASYKIAECICSIEKRAQLLNFGDSDKGSSGIGLGTVALSTLLAAIAAGAIGYNSGLEGEKNRPFTMNVQNYLGRSLDKLVRKVKPRPVYDLTQYTKSDDRKGSAS